MADGDMDRDRSFTQGKLCRCPSETYPVKESSTRYKLYLYSKDEKNDIGTTTLKENRENSQILSFYLFSLASFHQGY